MNRHATSNMTRMCVLEYAVSRAVLIFFAENAIVEYLYL
jgi:hypothetical protein